MRKFGGNWSESKLDCVERYALSYLGVMQKQHWCTLNYVDAFAGRGKQTLKSDTGSGAELREMDSFFGDESERIDTEEFLIGSAIRALRASVRSSRQFDRFIFIDVDKSSCLELESIVQSDFAEIRNTVEIICSDADTALGNYISKVDWSSTRALVFLDPYGLEVSWNLITRIAKTGACDAWYLFPLGGVIRLMTKNAHVPDTWRARLNRVFGTDEWYGEFYRPSGQQSLFEYEQKNLYRNVSTEHVIDFVRHRLQSIFPAVSNAGILRNVNGAPLFALVLGVSSPSPGAQQAALRIANHLVKDVSK
jgi:three-Cys-motif partner protein